MNTDPRLLPAQFPRSAKYHPDWLIANGKGSHPLWLVEWLTSGMSLALGMRVLDLGCGNACSSIFLAREFGVQVFAADLWISASDNFKRIADAGLSEQIIPLHVDARSLPFAGEYFDAITIIDNFSYYGTDDLYLNYLAHFLKPGGRIGTASAGLVREIEEPLPDHLAKNWSQDFWSLHSSAWWRRHWERTGIVEIESADPMKDGWRFWLDWQSAAHSENTSEIEMLTLDQGQFLGYIRVIARRNAGVKLEEYCWPDNLRAFPSDYQAKPVMRE